MRRSLPSACLSVWILAGCLFLGAAHEALAQPPLFTDALPKEEFAARRAKVLSQIGDAIVVLQGAAETPRISSSVKAISSST